MFGYLQPDLPYLYVKDGLLYRALYCGLCKSIGRGCGQRARFALSYDVTFLSALLHNIAGKDVTVTRQHCVLHPFAKRRMAEDDDLTRTLACLNTVLAYYKAADDVADERRGRGRRLLLKKGLKRARKQHPEAERIVRGHLETLLKLEKENCPSPERAADPFGQMVADLSDYCLGEKATEHTRGLCYGIGKWIYLIDALDDYDKDKKKGSYNPFRAAYGAESREQLLRENGEEIDFIFSAVFALNAEHLREIKFAFNHDLTDNIILRGMPAATQRVKCGCKARPEPIRL